MNVSLTPELVRFVQERVGTGMYGTASEVVREALRLLASQGLADEVREPAPPKFGVSEWQELREALLRGELKLGDERAADVAELFRLALESTRSRLRRDMPDASEEVIEAHLAKWLRERAGEPDGMPDGEHFARVSEERRRRILGE